MTDSNKRLFVESGIFVIAIAAIVVLTTVVYGNLEQSLMGWMLTP